MSEINNEREKIQDTKERKDSVDCENLGDAVGGKKKRNVKKSLFKKIVVGCIVCVLVICAILILPKILNPDGGMDGIKIQSRLQTKQKQLMKLRRVWRKR